MHFYTFTAVIAFVFSFSHLNVISFTNFYFCLFCFCLFVLTFLNLFISEYSDYFSDDKRRHTCIDCGKSYSVRGNLSRHRRQECPYSKTAIDLKCYYCNYMTRRQDTLKKHISTHINVKKDSSFSVWVKNIFFTFLINDSILFFFLICFYF